ncbi:hypothetical protein [Clostridium cylindrosporum]|uniref:2,3-bisphosphoglycerate-independent phosphoglycerate mutase 2 n=1 Tax=Clostridium cylindrosporum DSM 605 TaxID=1121307 RepID=A0A0J8G3J3_CLOCY|nr:hypothetical protein [Clostridium cylindrosporum]KMT22286.1 2,3-bisphosphoglycerate-independent phosphoglycerate mutase 2 [Clostridium cylindrosporum DSM 605]
MKEVLIILDGLMEKSLEGIDLKALILGDMDIDYTLDVTDYSLEGKDIDSLNCIMNMLGYSALEQDIGDRSFYEGLNQGIKDYEYILRCNIVRIRNGILEDFTGGNLSENIDSILREIRVEDGYVNPCYKYKNLLVINSSKNDLTRCKFYPPHFHVGDDIGRIIPENEYIKKIIYDSYEFFKSKGMEGCILWPWGPSRKVDLEPFHSKYKKVAGIVSGIDLVSGIGKALGMEAIQPIECNGDYDTKLNKKLDASIRLIKSVDFLIVHINGFDELAHRKDLNGKLDFVKKVRLEFLVPLINKLRAYGKCDITITCDHRTDSLSGAHEKGDVPILRIH